MKDSEEEYQVIAIPKMKLNRDEFIQILSNELGLQSTPYNFYRVNDSKKQIFGVYLEEIKIPNNKLEFFAE